jgi:hypothetical protein
MGAIAMTEPARPWPEQGQGLNSLIPRAKRRTGPLEAVPVAEPPLKPLPTLHQGAATWRANPHLHYLADPGATRPPTAVEAAEYAARRAGMDPELRWLYLLDADHVRQAAALGATDTALAPRAGSAHYGSDEGAIGYG